MQKLRVSCSLEKSNCAPAGRVLPGNVNGIQGEIKPRQQVRLEPMTYLKNQEWRQEWVEKKSPKRDDSQNSKEEARNVFPWTGFIISCSNSASIVYFMAIFTPFRFEFIQNSNFSVVRRRCQRRPSSMRTADRSPFWMSTFSQIVQPCNERESVQGANVYAWGVFIWEKVYVERGTLTKFYFLRWVCQGLKHSLKSCYPKY